MGGFSSRAIARQAQVSVVPRATAVPAVPRAAPSLHDPIHAKDNAFVDHVNDVTRASADDVGADSAMRRSVNAASMRPLPVSREAVRFEAPAVSGRLSAAVWADAIVQHRRDPQQHTIARLAVQYNIVSGDGGGRTAIESD